MSPPPLPCHLSISSLSQSSNSCVPSAAPLRCPEAAGHSRKRGVPKRTNAVSLRHPSILPGCVPIWDCGLDPNAVSPLGVPGSAGLTQPNLRKMLQMLCPPWIQAAQVAGAELCPGFVRICLAFARLTERSNCGVPNDFTTTSTTSPRASNRNGVSPGALAARGLYPHANFNLTCKREQNGVSPRGRLIREVSMPEPAKNASNAVSPLHPMLCPLGSLGSTLD